MHLAIEVFARLGVRLRTHEKERRQSQRAIPHIFLLILNEDLPLAASQISLISKKRVEGGPAINLASRFMSPFASRQAL